ncbi:MAG: hypothetical protein ACE3L7_16445 [Candidatus Pristimantibacillus sp.]|nr:hypothetical protein [Paenibacillus sp. FSL H7-0331]
MSNENESKDLKLEDLEKPLTETEMKETTGGALGKISGTVVRNGMSRGSN